MLILLPITAVMSFSQSTDRIGFEPQLIQSVPLIQADKAHQLGVTGRGVRVVVIDNFTPERGDPCSGDFVHGDWVKGVLEAVAPDANIVEVDVRLDIPGTSESPCYGFSSGVLERALETAWNMHQVTPIQVINYSIGGGRFDDWCNSGVTPTGIWIRRLVDEGVMFVTASGNAGLSKSTGFPGCMRETISVGAVYDYDDNAVERAGDLCSAIPEVDKVTCYSNAAFFLDVLAPGSIITVTPQLASLGTSASSPHVAGTIALLLQLDPSLRLQEIRNIIQTTGKPVLDSRNGLTFPRIDALAAVQDVMANLNNSPQVSLRVQPVQPIAGQIMFFNADASDADGDPLTFTWLLDGELQDATSASTTWESATVGTHTVRVTVFDGRGGEGAAEQTFEVLGTPASAATIVARALDQNNNSLLDDDEIEMAIRLWITSQPVDETSIIIADEAINELIAMWIRADSF
jgi:hypothetical protein